MKRFLHNLKQERLVGGALVLAITQFAASLAGLVRDNMLTRTFPGKDVVDVYIAAFRPSDLLFQATIMAAFSVALVPLLARYRAEEKSQSMSDLLNGVIGVSALAFGLMALVLAVCFSFIAPLLVHFEGESLQLYIRFGQIALLTNFLFVFGNAFGQYLITIQRYWIYGLTPVLYTLGTILGTVFLTPIIGAYGPMVGTLCGAVVYVFVRFIALLWIGYKPRFKLWHPDVQEMGWLMLPRMLALGALQFELLLFDRVASGLETGAVTVNAYSRNFQSVVIGVVGIALAQSAFSMLSQAAARREGQRFTIYLQKGIATLLALTLPSAIALWLLAPVAARLVHLTDVLSVFSICLGLYAISIPFESVNHLLLRSYYSLKRSALPAVMSVLNGFSAVLIAWWLSKTYGVYALPLGYTIGQCLQMFGLFIMLPYVLRKQFNTQFTVAGPAL